MKTIVAISFFWAAFASGVAAQSDDTLWRASYCNGVLQEVQRYAAANPNTMKDHCSGER